MSEVGINSIKSFSELEFQFLSKKLLLKILISFFLINMTKHNSYL